MQKENIQSIRERRLRGERGDHDCPFKDDSAAMADLGNIDWSGEDFSGCDLRGANLTHCNFSDAKFRNSVLWDADLSDSDLTGAIDLLPGQLAATDLTRAKLPATLSSFEELDSVKDLSNNASKVFITILVGIIYTFLTMATTKDSQLMTNTGSSKLPVIGIDIPTIGFYLVTPLILFALFLYLHIYLQRLWEAMSKLPSIFPNGRRLDEKTPAWLMNDLVRHHLPRLRRLAPRLSSLQAWISVFLGYWLVPVTLIVMWAKFLPMQSWPGTIAQILVITAAIACAAYSTRLLQMTFGQNAFRRSRVEEIMRGIGALWGIPAGGLVLLVTSYCSFVVIENTGQVPEPAIAFLNFLGFETGPVIDGTEISVKPTSWTGLDANRDVELGLSKGAILSHRSLRRIHALNTFFAKASLTQDDFSFGDFTGSDFRLAEMHGITAIGAKFIRCKFADFTPSEKILVAALRPEVSHSAFLSGCVFNGAELRGANMAFVTARICDFTGADFQAAQCFGAEFLDCRLGKADFSASKCRHAKFLAVTAVTDPILFARADCSDVLFSGCHFPGANFRWAVLDRAIFDEVDLSDADFSNCSLQGTNLYKATGLKEEQMRKALSLFQCTLPPDLAGKLEKEVETPLPPKEAVQANANL